MLAASATTLIVTAGLSGLQSQSLHAAIALKFFVGLIVGVVSTANSGFDGVFVSAIEERL